MGAHGRLRTPAETRGRPRAHMGAQEHAYGLAHGRPWAPTNGHLPADTPTGTGAKWRSRTSTDKHRQARTSTDGHGRPQMPIYAVDVHRRAPMGIRGCLWASMGARGRPWRLWAHDCAHGRPWISMGIRWHPWAPMDIRGLQLACMIVGRPWACPSSSR